MSSSDENELEWIGGDAFFPIQWLKTDPRKVERILKGMSVFDQVRYVMQLDSIQKQEVIVLSPKSKEIVRALPPEEIYFLIQELGKDDSMPVLSALSQQQIQYIFDLEWWHRDKFMPDLALKWIMILNRENPSELFQWFYSEDFDQIVMVLQSLIKVYKRDELTDSYEGVEGLSHFSPDSIFDIFFLYPNTENLLKPLFNRLQNWDVAHFRALMEGVIWYSVTPTIENAYERRLSRTSSRGIPGFEEAIEIYSRLEPGSSNTGLPSLESFSSDEVYPVAPNHLVAQIDSSGFFGLCLSLIENTERLDTIRWELVYLANKVMIADRKEPSDLESKKQGMEKVLGFINIGLELVCNEETHRGIKVLENSWIQPLFQVAYGYLMKIKFRIQNWVREHREMLNTFLNDKERDQLAALIATLIPKRIPDPQRPEILLDFKSLNEIKDIETLEHRMMFYDRCSRKALNLNSDRLTQQLALCKVPEQQEDFDFCTLLTTTFARFILFQEISWEPITEPAAQSFVETVFVPGIFKDESRPVNRELVDSFRKKFLKTPLAWTDQDRKCLMEVLEECVANLEEQFGNLNLKQKVDWRYTRGLCIRD